MHGIVHKTLKEHVDENVEGVDWDGISDRAGLEPKLYLPVSHYPDEEVTAVFEALASSTGADEAAVQRAFGRHLGPELLDTFKAHVRDDWATREVLLALETIYERVAAQNEETDLPGVSTDADGDDVVVTYRSDRELCPLAEGIVLGIADHYGDDVELAQPTCTRSGADHCTLRVTLS